MKKVNSWVLGLRYKYLLEAIVLSTSLLIRYWGSYPGIETTMYTDVIWPLLYQPVETKAQGTCANGIILANAIPASKPILSL